MLVLYFLSIHLVVSFLATYRYLCSFSSNVNTPFMQYILSCEAPYVIRIIFNPFIEHKPRFSKYKLCTDATTGHVYREEVPTSHCALKAALALFLIIEFGCDI